MVEKLVRHDFIEVWPSLRVAVEDSGDEVACLVRNGHMLWEGVAVLTDAPVRGFHIGGFEGRFAND